MAKEADAVAVAKVSARQAIVVALITAIAGLVTVLVTRKPATAEGTHWLQIEAIDAQNRDPIRLIISVNGIYYSYPSTAAFLVPGPNIPRERFPIPAARDYAVSFRMISPNGRTGESSEVDLLASAPSEGREYRLWDGGSVRGSGGDVPPYRIRYSFR